MRKHLLSIIFYILSLSVIMVPICSRADFYVIAARKPILTGPQKSLCDFPFGTYGTFEVRYDRWVYDPDYFVNQFPNGGITLELWLGFFASVGERDDIVNKIIKVMFVKNDTGESFELTQAAKFPYLSYQSAGYSIILGSESNVKGNWDIFVQADDGYYKASFTLTQEMLDKAPPIPVDPEVSTAAEISVSASVTNGDAYRLKIYDNNGDLIFSQDMDILAGVTAYITNIPLQYSGYKARIETREFDPNWLALYDPDNPATCNPNGMVIGEGSQRAVVWFKLE